MLRPICTQSRLPAFRGCCPLRIGCPQKMGTPPCAAPLYCHPCTAPPMLYDLSSADHAGLHPAVASREARGRRVASRTNQIVRALQGSMDSLTHDAYIERRELAWRTAGVVPDGAYSMVVLDGACGTRGSLWSVTGVGACAWCTAWRHQGMQRYAINSGRGPHTLLGEHFEWEGLINCLKDCLRRCTGLGASQGAVHGGE